MISWLWRTMTMALVFLFVTAWGWTPSGRVSALGTTPAVSSRQSKATLQSGHSGSRRRALAVLAGGGVLGYRINPAAGAIGLPGKERRQLDLCIVNVLRVKYWAQTMSIDLQNVNQEDRRKQLYLESRLGAKALVTSRVGGGATGRVYSLATLQFRGCLEDIAWYGKSKEVSQLTQDLLEALAAIVEFDGLETTTDPSPRSSLMLSMYNAQKETFVRRMLSERVVPTADSLVKSFDPTLRRRCEQYIETTYPNEAPKKQPLVVADGDTDEHEAMP